MLLRARWEGSPPQVGEFLMSQVRPRHAYRIEGIEQKRLDKATQRTYLALTCTKVASGDVPAGAVVHPWKWDARKKTGFAWSAAS